MKVTYAIYKGDEFIDVGSVKELSERLNVSKSCIYSLYTKSQPKIKQKEAPTSTIVIKI